MSESGLGAVKVVAAVDGTSSEFDCGTHNFKTKDLQKYKEHLSEPGHYDVGTTPCMICGKPKTEFEYKHKSQHIIRSIVMHEQCKEEFIKGI
jgi:hypothetical protein